MAFQLPPFQAMPMVVIADPANPDRGKVQVYHTQVATWRHVVDCQMGFIAPQYVMPALLVMYAVNAMLATCLAQVREVQDLVIQVFAEYATEYNNFARQITQAGGPQPANIPLPQA